MKGHLRLPLIPLNVTSWRARRCLYTKNKKQYKNKKFWKKLKILKKKNYTVVAFVTPRLPVSVHKKNQIIWSSLWSTIGNIYTNVLFPSIDWKICLPACSYFLRLYWMDLCSLEFNFTLTNISVLNTKLVFKLSFFSIYLIGKATIKSIKVGSN